MWSILRKRAIALGAKNVRFASGLSQEQIQKTHGKYCYYYLVFREMHSRAALL